MSASAAAEKAPAPSAQHVASCDLGNKAQADGNVKKVNASTCDLEARAEAVCDREAWENAMEIMLERKSGWVHARITYARW